MSDVFTKDLLDSVGGTVAERLAASEEVTRDQARDALASLSPVLLSGLKRKQEEVGASGLEALMIDAGGSEDDLDDLDGMIERGRGGDGAGLGGILDEDSQEQTAMALSKKLGVGTTVVKRLIPILAPIILSMLMRKGTQQSGGRSRSGGIGSILDRDGDGSIIDDIAGMVLSGQMGGGQGGGGFWRMLLGFFLRR